MQTIAAKRSGSAINTSARRLTLVLFALLVGCGLFDSNDDATPVTVRVQYVNYTGNTVKFDVFDANGDVAGGHFMNARTIADAADPEGTVGGVLPMDVAVLVTKDAFSDQVIYQITKDNTSCTIPTVFGVGGKVQSVMKKAVEGKIVRIEARPNGLLECVAETP